MFSSRFFSYEKLTPSQIFISTKSHAAIKKVAVECHEFHQILSSSHELEVEKEKHAPILMSFHTNC